MPTCDTPTCNANRARAHQINVLRTDNHKSALEYYAINSTIHTVTGGNLDFSPTGDNITTGDIRFRTDGTDGKPHYYHVAKNQTWFDCPSTARQPSEVGDLYIECVTATGLRSDDADGVAIYGTTSIGATPPLLTSTKWPDTGGDEVTTPTAIWPTKLIVEGSVDGAPSHVGHVDLTDAAVAGFSQSISFGHGAPIIVNLTAKGRGEFGLAPFADAAAEARLTAALDLVVTKYRLDDDVQPRADAWALIAGWRRYLEWCERSGHGDANKLRLRELIQSRLRDATNTQGQGGVRTAR